MEYVLIVKSHLTELNAEVNRLLSGGWELYGNHNITKYDYSTIYSQGMVRIPKPSIPQPKGKSSVDYCHYCGSVMTDKDHYYVHPNGWDVVCDTCKELGNKVM